MRLRKTFILFLILLLTVSIASADEFNYHYKHHHWHDRYSWYEDEGSPDENVPPETPSNYSEFTTEKLCRDGVCWVGADGDYLILRNNVSAKNPSYKQLVSFLKADKTDEKSYTTSYQCGDFAETVHNNAEKAGIKCAWVAFIGANHAACACRTTDRGLVYFDCTGVPGGESYQDKIVDVEIGNPLSEEYLFRDGGFFMSGDVKKIVVFW